MSENEGNDLLASAKVLSDRCRHPRRRSSKNLLVASLESKVLLYPFLLCFCFLLISCEKPPIDSNELVERDGVFYRKFSDTPFSGKVTGSKQGSVVDGNWEGTRLSFFENGNLKMSTNFLNGVKHGEEKKYQQDGKLTQVANFQNGIMHGEYRYFGVDGLTITDYVHGNNALFRRYNNEDIQIVKTPRDKDEQIHGKQQFFHDSGSVLYELEYNSGSLMHKEVKVHSVDGLVLEVPVEQREGIFFDSVRAHGETFIQNNKECAVAYDFGKEVSWYESEKNGTQEVYDAFINADLAYENATTQAEKDRIGRDAKTLADYIISQAKPYPEKPDMSETEEERYIEIDGELVFVDPSVPDDRLVGYLKTYACARSIRALMSKTYLIDESSKVP